MGADDQDVEAGIMGAGSGRPPASRRTFPAGAAAGTAAASGTMRAAVLDAPGPPWPSASSRQRGMTVLSSTRNPGKAEAVTRVGADHVLIDDGHVARQVREILPGGADAALELVGTPTLPDTLRSVRIHGVVCFTGMLSNQWTVRDFYPLDDLPHRRAADRVQGGRRRPHATRLAGLPRRRRRQHGRRPHRPRVPVRPDRGGAHRHGAEPGQRQARRHDMRWLPMAGGAK